MSCKRSDITNLIGCRIGDVAIRGCCRGCCNYSDDEISENTRDYLLRNRSGSYRHKSYPPPPGRTGLHYIACQTSWRPKFICPKPTCRRGIKPAYDPDKNEYRISEYGDWEVRSRPERDPGLKEAMDNYARLNCSHWGRESTEKREIDELWKRYTHANREDPNEEEMEMLKRYYPDLWWTKVITIPRYGVGVEEHLVRCPNCGESAVRVGSNFRIPKKTDEKGWKEVEEIIERGDDMVATFSVCSTVEVHEEMVEEAQMRLAKKKTEGPWLEEKRRRIVALGLKPKD